MTEQHFTEQIKSLIDSLKTICANYGLGNDGNEFKIISQAFLYKFLNDKYDFEVKKIRKEKPDEPIEFVNMDIDGKTAVLKPEHSIKYLSERQNGADFAKLFDDTLTDIAACNADLFSVKTEGGAKKSNFCAKIASKLKPASLEISARQICRILHAARGCADYGGYFGAGGGARANPQRGRLRPVGRFGNAVDECRPCHRRR